MSRCSQPAAKVVYGYYLPVATARSAPWPQQQNLAESLQYIQSSSFLESAHCRGKLRACTVSPLLFCGRRCPHCFAILGSGSLAEALVPLVKAQLLAFLIYTTPALLQQQLQGAGQTPEKVQEGTAEDHTAELGQKLPRPCPVLRRLITFDPGKTLSRVFSCFCSSCLHSSQPGMGC